MMQQVETKKQARQSLGWIGQAVSGILLIVIVLLHMSLHHFQSQGLLSASEVIAQVSNPAFLALEILFVIVVTYHALPEPR
jgi:succinate dehydrogenase hydrophobic anchor subunit